MTTAHQQEPDEGQPMTADRIVAERIHVLLFRRRMTKKALAEAIGLTGAGLGKKVNGQSTFTLDELLAIARALEVSPMELLPDASHEPVLAGRGRKTPAGGSLPPAGDDDVVRHVGLEPTTR